MDANFSGSVQPVVGVQTPTVHGFTVYTVMLILSFIALTTASILLFLDANKY